MSSNRSMSRQPSQGELDTLSRSSMRMIQARNRTSALYAQVDSDSERSMNATKAMIQESMNMLPEDAQRLVRASVISYLKEADKVRTEIYRLRERQEHSILRLQDAKMRLRATKRLSDKADPKTGFFAGFGKKKREAEALRKVKLTASKAIDAIESAINEREKAEETIQRLQIEERRILSEVNFMVQQHVTISRGALTQEKEEQSDFSKRIGEEENAVFKEQND